VTIGFARERVRGRSRLRLSRWTRSRCAPGRDRLLPLSHPWKGSSEAGTAAFHARQQPDSPDADCCFARKAIAARDRYLEPRREGGSCPFRFFLFFVGAHPAVFPMADRRRPPSPCRHDGDDAKSVNSAANPACGSSTSDIPAIRGHAHTSYRSHDLSQLRRSRPGSGSLDRVGCESLSVRGCAPGRTHRSPPTWRSVDMFGRARAQCSGARRRRDSDPQRQRH
jgi:hypothetical protein